MTKHTISTRTTRTIEGPELTGPRDTVDTVATQIIRRATQDTHIRGHVVDVGLFSNRLARLRFRFELESGEATGPDVHPGAQQLGEYNQRELERVAAEADRLVRSWQDFWTWAQALELVEVDE